MKAKVRRNGGLVLQEVGTLVSGTGGQFAIRRQRVSSFIHASGWVYTLTDLHANQAICDFSTREIAEAVATEISDRVPNAAADYNVMVEIVKRHIRDAAKSKA